MKRFELGGDHAGQRLDKLIVSLVGVGRATARRLFDEGRVSLEIQRESGPRVRRAVKGDVARAGEVLLVDLEETSEAAVADPGAPLLVRLERADLLVVDKPANQATAPLRPGERGTLANALVGAYPELAGVGFHPREPGLCHRLDTGTSGLVLVGRTAESFSTLTQALRGGEIDKRYLLVCASHELADAGTIDIPLAPHPKDKRRIYPCVHERDVARYDPRAATTHYQVLRRAGEWALVEARVDKALRHQIRAHFAAIEHPLAGDELYGGAPIEGLGRHALHASRIAWPGGTGHAGFDVTSPLPDELGALVG